MKTYSKVQRLSKLLNSESRVNRKCSLNKEYDDEGWNPRSKDIVRYLQKCRHACGNGMYIKQYV